MGKICEFYKGKNVLVTGATGYCGKVLVEKLLRTCVGIGNIFIIVRRKKNGKRKLIKSHKAYDNFFNLKHLQKSDILPTLIIW